MAELSDAFDVLALAGFSRAAALRLAIWNGHRVEFSHREVGDGEICDAPMERRDRGRLDHFRAHVDLIVDMDYPLAKVARSLDWGFLEAQCGAVFSNTAGHPPLPTRLTVGLPEEISAHAWLVANIATAKQYLDDTPHVQSAFFTDDHRTTALASYRLESSIPLPTDLALNRTSGSFAFARTADGPLPAQDGRRHPGIYRRLSRIDRSQLNDEVRRSEDQGCRLWRGAPGGYFEGQLRAVKRRSRSQGDVWSAYVC